MLNIFCIYNFVERTNFIIIMADKKDKFSIKKINHSQIIYLLFGGIIVLVQLIIVYFIFKNSFQKFLWVAPLMKLSHLEKKYLKKLRFLNLYQVEKNLKKVL